MRSTLSLAAAFGCLFFGGCTVPADPPPIAPSDLPDAFSTSGTLKSDPQWWLAFEDAGLNRAVETALVSNLSLQATWERLSQARAAARKSAAARYPDLSLSGGASNAENRGTSDGSSQSFSAGLAAGYEVDLWGGVAATAEAAALDADASEAALRTAALSLSAEVATLWYRLQGAQMQYALLQRQRKINENYLALTERKFRSAQARASDVLQQRQSLEAVNGNIVTAQNDITLYEHQLAVLMGQLPGNLAYEPLPGFTPLPPLPATGVPSTLLAERPDVKAAFYDLQAADRRVAAAVAERYPQLSLSASIQSSALRAADLFEAWVLNLAANLSAPLIDGGARRAEVARTEAVRNEALYTYAQTLLEAFREVEDALSEREHQLRYVESLDAQLALSAAAVEQLRSQYLHGSGSFEAFLSAQLSHQSLERTRVTAARELREKQITLYRALSTGWNPQRQKPMQRSADAGN